MQQHFSFCKYLGALCLVWETREIINMQLLLCPFSFFLFMSHSGGLPPSCSRYVFQRQPFSVPIFSLIFAREQRWGEGERGAVQRTPCPAILVHFWPWVPPGSWNYTISYAQMSARAYVLKQRGPQSTRQEMALQLSYYSLFYGLFVNQLSQALNHVKLHTH